MSSIKLAKLVRVVDKALSERNAENERLIQEGLRKYHKQKLKDMRALWKKEHPNHKVTQVITITN